MASERGYIQSMHSFGLCIIPPSAIAVLLSQNHSNLYTGATVVYADVKCRDVINLGASDLWKVMCKYFMCIGQAFLR